MTHNIKNNTTSNPACNPSATLLRPADRNDPRLLRLRRDLGLEGYAVYSMLQETAAHEGGSVSADYSLLAYDLRADERMVRSVAEDYQLFLISGGLLMLLPTEHGSELSRKRSEAGRKGMRSRWASRRGIANDNKTITNPDEKKEKENFPPAPPIKEKDKEKAEERKENSALDDKTENDGNVFCRKFQDYWNKCVRQSGSRLKPVSILSASRRRQLERLRRQYDGQQIAWLVWRACHSPYLNARDGRLRQPADLDWMLATDERIVKIIEGNM